MWTENDTFLPLHTTICLENEQWKTIEWMKETISSGCKQAHFIQFECNSNTEKKWKHCNKWSFDCDNANEYFIFYFVQHFFSVSMLCMEIDWILQHWVNCTANVIDADVFLSILFFSWKIWNVKRCSFVIGINQTSNLAWDSEEFRFVVINILYRASYSEPSVFNGVSKLRFLPFHITLNHELSAHGVRTNHWKSPRAAVYALLPNTFENSHRKRRFISLECAILRNRKSQKRKRNYQIWSVNLMTIECNC